MRIIDAKIISSDISKYRTAAIKIEDPDLLTPRYLRNNERLPDNLLRSHYLDMVEKLDITIDSLQQTNHNDWATETDIIDKRNQYQYLVNYHTETIIDRKRRFEANFREKRKKEVSTQYDERDITIDGNDNISWDHNDCKERLEESRRNRYNQLGSTIRYGLLQRCSKGKPDTTDASN